MTLSFTTHKQYICLNRERELVTHWSNVIWHTLYLLAVLALLSSVTTTTSVCQTMFIPVILRACHSTWIFMLWLLCDLSIQTRIHFFLVSYTMKSQLFYNTNTMQWIGNCTGSQIWVLPFFDAQCIKIGTRLKRSSFLCQINGNVLWIWMC